MVSLLSGPHEEQSRFVVDALRADDKDAIDQAAALLVEAFPHWLPTMEMAREEVTEALEFAHLPSSRERGTRSSAGSVPSQDTVTPGSSIPWW